MKGIIAICLKEMVIEKYGIEMWEKCLLNSGATSDVSFDATSDIEDDYVIGLIDVVCKSLGVSRQEAFNVFGEYWVCTFSQKVYSHYYRKYKSAKEFILAMDKVHLDLTRSLENAEPPRFEYEWKNADTLLITYISKRALVDFAAGLIKGVGKHYSEDLQVVVKGNTIVQVTFRERN